MPKHSTAECLCLALVLMVLFATGTSSLAQVAPSDSKVQPRKPIVQRGHSARLHHAVFEDKKDLLVTTSQTFVHSNPLPAILWNSQTGEKLREFPTTKLRTSPVFCIEGEAVSIGGTVYRTDDGRRITPMPKGDRHPLANFDLAKKKWIGIVENRVEVIDLATEKKTSSWALKDFCNAAEVDPSNFISRRSRARLIVDMALTTANEPLILVRSDSTRRLEVWKLLTKTRQCIIPIDIIDSARFSRSGAWVVTRHWGDTGSSDEETIVYDASSGTKIVKTFEWLYRESPLFSPDDRFYVSGTTQKVARLWDLKNAKKVHEFSGHLEPIYSMGLLKNGTVLETRSRDQALRWSMRTGKRLKTFANLTGKSPAKTYSGSNTQPVIVGAPDAAHFLSGTRLLDYESGKEKAVFHARRRDPVRQHRYQVARAIFGGGSSRVLIDYSGSHAQQSVLFDVDSGESIQQIAATPTTDPIVAWNSDGTRTITRFPTGYLLWDVPDGKLLQAIGYKKNTNSQALFHGEIDFTKNGKFVYAHGQRIPLLLWNAVTGEPLDGAVNDLRPSRDVELAKDDPKSGLRDGTVRSGRYFGVSTVDVENNIGASWHRDSSERGTIQLWNLDRGRLMHTFKLKTKTRTLVSISPNGKTLVALTGLSDWTAGVWDISTGKRLHTWKPIESGNGQTFPTASFLDGGKKTLIISPSRDLLLFDTETGELIHRMTNEKLKPGNRMFSIGRDVLVSPDEKLAAVSSAGRYVLIWDLVTGKLVKRVERDLGGISVKTYFQFSDDSQTLATRFRPEMTYGLFKVAADQKLAIRHGQEIPGFSPSPQQKLFIESKSQQKSLHEKYPQVPQSAKIRMLEAGRYLLRYPDGKIEVRKADGSLVYECYPFEYGEAWLTITPDGRARGATKYVRYAE